MDPIYGIFAPQDHGGEKPKPPRPPPGRGALDGLRKDVQAAKDAGVAYDPRGAGAAWNHNFLNKKPWHPLTFKNMQRVWEKEHDDYEKEKRKVESQAEFRAEQEYLKTLSLLSAEEQERYRQRQSVSFLYMKPPGYDASLERTERAKQQAGEDGDAAAAGGAAGAAAGGAEAAVAGAAAGGGGGGGSQPPGGPALHHQQQGIRVAAGGGHLKHVLGGIKAVAQQAQHGELALKHAPGGGRSPPRGGASLEAPNQQFVVGEMDSDEEEAALRLALMPEAERRRLRQEGQRAQRAQAKAAEAAGLAAAKALLAAERAKRDVQLEQAKAYLRAAGLAIPSDSDADSPSNSGGSGEDGGGSGRNGRDRRQRKKGGSGGSRAKRRRHGGTGTSKRQRQSSGGQRTHMQHKKRRQKD